jgi:hypothetical protein
MNKATKVRQAEVKTEAAVEEVETRGNTAIMRVVTPYTDDMMTVLEERLDAQFDDGFKVAACVPYGVDRMVVILQKAA